MAFHAITHPQKTFRSLRTHVSFAQSRKKKSFSRNHATRKSHSWNHAHLWGGEAHLTNSTNDWRVTKAESCWIFPKKKLGRKINRTFAEKKVKCSLFLPCAWVTPKINLPWPHGTLSFLIVGGGSAMDHTYYQNGPE